MMFSPKTHENLIVGIETSDDAGVYRLSDDTALIHTADIIPPVTSDPYIYGQVAAANALSDVYAMGGRPLTALNLCFFPADDIRMETLGAILRGGLLKVEESGALLVGGHTIKDKGLKYGISVTGLVDPHRLIRNTGGRPGDKLILTKPIGTGVHITAYRRGILRTERFEAVLDTMTTLNRIASESAIAFDVLGGTDITGFGLAGHCLEIANGSKVGIRIHVDSVPRFPDTLELIEQGVGTALTSANRSFVQERVRFEDQVDAAERELLYDPQTSGGLLIFVKPDNADELLDDLHRRGVAEARIVGDCFEALSPHIHVLR